MCGLVRSAFFAEGAVTTGIPGVLLGVMAVFIVLTCNRSTPSLVETVAVLYFLCI